MFQRLAQLIQQGMTKEFIDLYDANKDAAEIYGSKMMSYPVGSRASQPFSLLELAVLQNRLAIAQHIAPKGLMRHTDKNSLLSRYCLYASKLEATADERHWKADEDVFKWLLASSEDIDHPIDHWTFLHPSSLKTLIYHQKTPSNLVLLYLQEAIVRNLQPVIREHFKSGINEYPTPNSNTFFLQRGMTPELTTNTLTALRWMMAEGYFHSPSNGKALIEFIEKTFYLSNVQCLPPAITAHLLPAPNADLQTLYVMFYHDFFLEENVPAFVIDKERHKNCLDEFIFSDDKEEAINALVRLQQPAALFSLLRMDPHEFRMRLSMNTEASGFNVCAVYLAQIIMSFSDTVVQLGSIQPGRYETRPLLTKVEQQALLMHLHRSVELTPSEKMMTMLFKSQLLTKKHQNKMIAGLSQKMDGMEEQLNNQTRLLEQVMGLLGQRVVQDEARLAHDQAVAAVKSSRPGYFSPGGRK